MAVPCAWSQLSPRVPHVLADLPGRRAVDKGNVFGEAMLGTPLTFLCQVFVLDDPGQAKISNFATERLRDEDVGGSQVTVDGIHSLDVCHPLCHLGEEERARLHQHLPMTS